MKFSEALDRKMEEVKRPPVPPVGHYVWQVAKHPDHEEFDSKDGKHFERLTFSLRAVQAGEDVDPDDLAEFGNVAGFPNRKTFLFSNDEEDQAAFDRSMFQLRRFLECCGVDESVSIQEGLAAAVGGQFLGQLNHRPDPNDPEVIYAEVGNTAPLE